MKEDNMNLVEYYKQQLDEISIIKKGLVKLRKSMRGDGAVGKVALAASNVVPSLWGGVSDADNVARRGINARLGLQRKLKATKNTGNGSGIAEAWKPMPVRSKPKPKSPHSPISRDPSKPPVRPLNEKSQASLRRAARSLLKKKKKLENINFPLTKESPATGMRIPDWSLGIANIELANASGKKLQGVNASIRSLVPRFNFKTMKAARRQGEALLRHEMGLPPMPKPGQPNSNQGVKKRTGQSIGDHAKRQMESGKKLLDLLHNASPYA